jgi:2-phosphosulfolactate phosphatase
VIDVAFTPEELRGTPLGGRTVVVIDVVRASTTIVTALANGARGVLPVATPEEAVARAGAWGNGAALLGGEREGAPPPGFALGNSPAEYARDQVGGQTVIFTTTNGTRALLAVRMASRVVVGAFANAAAVTRWVGRGPEDALLVCAGEAGRFCLEDATCAGLFVTRLRSQWQQAALSDSARAAALLYTRYREDLTAMLAEATWAQALAAQGRGADLPLCIQLDVYETVPVARNGMLVPAMDH